MLYAEILTREDMAIVRGAYEEIHVAGWVLTES